ncbi:type II toxin-antitoxin system prevent-host-death family antitoxin [Roseomonas mucosa]
MRSFSTSELVRDIREVTHAATRAPVTITQHSKPRFVLMAIEDYERLSRPADPRRVFGAGEAPEEIAALFLPELERLAAQAEEDGHGA